MANEIYDVFVSYSRADWRHAAEIDSVLRAKGLRSFFDRRNLVPGLPWVRALEQAIGASKAVIVLIGPRGLGNTQQYERDLAFYRQTREPAFPVVPVILPETTTDRPFDFLQILMWVDFSHVAKVSDAPDQLERLLAAVQGGPATGEEVRAATAICPYRGLDAFREEDAAFFFGRGSVGDVQTPIGELVHKVREHPFVMAVGGSGSGKSSLVYAGLLPALRRERDRFWNVLSLRPGPTPLRALAAAFNPRADDEGAAEYATKITNEADKLRVGDPELLSHMIRQELDRTEGKPDRLLLYIDQWEELYAQAPSSNDRERAAQHSADVNRFIDLLLNASRSGPVTVVATVRADFYDPLIGHQEIKSLLPTRQVLLGKMLRSDLESTIVEPARKVGLTFDPPSLVQRILDEAGDDEGMLPLLQYALKETWALRKGNAMTGDSYARSGGVREAIRLTAERTFEALSAEDQKTARQLFLRLVTPGEGREDTRTRAAMPMEAAQRRIVEQFTAPRTRLLVTGSDRAGRPTLEVAHEALIRTWLRLREWIDSNREKLRARAAVLQAKAEWEQQGRREDLLLPAGFHLERARTLLADPGDLTITDIQEFISLSSAREEFLATSRRRARIVRSTVLIGSIVIILAAWLAYNADQARLAAEQARIAAERGQSLAQLQHSRLLADRASQSSEDDDAGTAALLALEALPDARSGINRPKAPEAETALVHALQRLQELVVLKGHTDWINQAAFDSQGERVVTTSRDKTARIWKVATGEQLATLPHNDEVFTALFSPDDRYVVTASGKAARIWDLTTNKVVQTLTAHEGSVETVAFSSDGKFLVTALEDNTARIWNVETGELVRTLKGHAAQVWSAVFSPDGRRIVTASRDQTARIWDAVTGDELKSLRGHTDSVWLAAFNLAGSRVLTASRDSTVRIWDAENAKELKTIRHFDDIIAAGFSDDGSRIVLISRDNKLRIFDAESGYEITARNGHRDWILSTSFSRDGTRIVTGSRDYTARIWDAETSQTISGLEAKGGPVSGAAFSPGARLVATSSRESTSARVWDVKSGKAVAVLNGHEKPVWSTAFNKEGTLVVTASEDKTARIWGSETGVPLTILSGHQGTVWSAAFSPDGKYVVTASADTTARIWDAETGASVVILGTGAGTAGDAIEGGHNNDVLSAGFSADAKRVVTGSRDYTLLVWDLEGRKRLAVLSDVYEDDVVSAVFSPVNRSLVASASTDGSAHIWNVDTNTITALKGHNGPVWSVAFNSNGRQVVTASGDMTARVWDAESGQLVQTFKGHSNWVFSAAFTSDDKHVVTASRDKTVRIWDIETGDDVTGGVISGSTQELVERAKERVPRCLTRDQREKAFLAAEPPAWCIEMEKWPYHTQDWKDWLRFKKANADPPLPDTPEWQPWIAAHR